MKAAIIGSGRIGCGFAGQLLRAAGYDLVFLARNGKMVAHLNRLGCYRVRLANGQHIELMTAPELDAFLYGLESAHQAWRESINDWPAREPAGMRQWHIKSVERRPA